MHVWACQELLLQLMSVEVVTSRALDEMDFLRLRFWKNMLRRRAIDMFLTGCFTSQPSAAKKRRLRRIVVLGQ